ncbi:SSI family serine proteinase inhibitor [Kutzneria buriramensis]|uniref:SSI family serine proteinase inhibitor n=2 Tax=Kutzneria buriramensis TaxID=1045776 RepID=UPI00374A0A5A
MKYIGSSVTAVLVFMRLMTSPTLAASPANRLDLTITSEVGVMVAQATLTCEPTDGTRPHAQEACNDLVATKGQIDKIPPKRACFSSHGLSW